MLIPHSNTPDSQPIQAGDGAESQHQRMGGWGRKVLYSSERALLTAGLICVLVYVCTRTYATAMYQAGLWSFSQLKSGAPTVKSENHRHAVDFTLWGRKARKGLQARIGNSNWDAFGGALDSTAAA